MTTPFPPSTSEFQESINSFIIRPLLQFIEETNSSFVINIYPYKINSAIPIGFALFQDYPFNFRDDTVTGVRYWNLFDMMMDSVISGHENMPLIAAETGWPSEVETKTAGNYPEIYLKEFVAHLKSGLGTPLRKEGVAEAYIYELFDSGSVNSTSEGASMSEGTGLNWGIMYPNMTMKYYIHSSGSKVI